jgi:thioredoxin-dependent peroxiredoxin
MVRLTLTRLLLVPGVALALEVGEQAPDFTLPSTRGEPISLRQFRGKQHVLLEFYVRDHAPTWMKNPSARKVDYRVFQALGVQVLGIAAEHTFSQRPFADSLALP